MKLKRGVKNNTGTYRPLDRVGVGDQSGGLFREDHWGHLLSFLATAPFRVLLRQLHTISKVYYTKRELGSQFA